MNAIINIFIAIGTAVVLYFFIRGINKESDKEIKALEKLNEINNKKA